MLTRWTTAKLLWVHSKLALKEKFAPRLRDPEFVGGESFCYLGRRYRLRIDRGLGSPLCFDGKEFRIKPDVESPGEHFRAWYTRTGTPWVSERTQFLAKRTGYQPSHTEVRDLGCRWGSCGKNDVLFFNWKILQLPVRLVDYVIVHELMHLGERRHSTDFWRSVERVMPDWRERKEALVVKAKDYMVFGIHDVI
jgi:predicted metal-dependent hydrolase